MQLTTIKQNDGIFIQIPKHIMKDMDKVVSSFDDNTHQTRIVFYPKQETNISPEVQQLPDSLNAYSNNDCFVLMTVIIELAWVLKSQKINKAIIIQKLIELSRLLNIHLENIEVFKNAMRWAITGVDIADAIHLALSQSYKKLPMTTFDSAFIKKSKALDKVATYQNVSELINK